MVVILKERRVALELRVVKARRAQGGTKAHQTIDLAATTTRVAQGREAPGQITKPMKELKIKVHRNTTYLPLVAIIITVILKMPRVKISATSSNM